jgi:hypothetical protein
MFLLAVGAIGSEEGDIDLKISFRLSIKSYPLVYGRGSSRTDCRSFPINCRSRFMARRRTGLPRFGVATTPLAVALIMIGTLLVFASLVAVALHRNMLLHSREQI